MKYLSMYNSDMRLIYSNVSTIVSMIELHVKIFEGGDGILYKRYRSFEEFYYILDLRYI